MAKESFSLLAGPLHELGRRIGLVRGTHTVPLGLAVGIGLWLLLVGVVLIAGDAGHSFTPFAST